jgi:Domain of unknown function (DUF3883)
MPSVRLTPGRLTALWLILQTLAELGGRAEISDVSASARRSALRAGGLPVPDGLRLAREGGFVFESAGTCVLEPLGERALAMSDEEEPPPEVLRLFITVLFLRLPPPWVAWWQGSPGDIEAVVPAEEQRVMRDAGLLPQPPIEDPGGWAWWEALGRVPLAEHTAAARKEIGDAGEELSFEFERRRLRAEGYDELADAVDWIARDSDAYGFDVLSFAGDDHAPLDPNERIAIEVKSTALPVIEDFPLFFTAHEWEVLSRLGPRGVLHLWPAVEAGPPPRSRAEQPIVCAPATLAEHLPGPPTCGEPCGWQSAELRVKVA